MAHSLTQEQITAVTGAIFGGQRIEAVKLYREATNTSLVEAKEFVEKLEAELRLQHPDRFKATPQLQSMTLIVLIAVIVAVGVGVAAVIFVSSIAH